MVHLWMLSKHYTTSNGEVRPVARCYSWSTFVPEFGTVDDQWHLCFCRTGQHQIEAAKQDPRVQIFRTLFAKVTPELVAEYARYGAEEGMTLGECLNIMSETEPNFMMDAHEMMK